MQTDQNPTPEPYQRMAPVSPSPLEPATARALSQRFLALPPDKQRQFYAKCQAEGVAFNLLPIPAEPASTAPLSLFQQGLWVLHELDQTSTAYHIAGAIRIEGELDLAALRRAFTALAGRHDSLRTVFGSEDGVALMRVRPDPEPPLAYHDLSSLPLAEAGVQAKALTDAAVLTPFALDRAPPWRLLVLKRAGRVHELNVVLHHLLADGWSMNRLLAEFAALYQAETSGAEADLPPLPIGYADYARWQRAGSAAGALAGQLAYWTAKLEGEPPVLELPYDYPRPEQPGHLGGRVAFQLEPGIGQAVTHLAKRQQTSVFTVLLAGFAALLYRYGGQTALRLGVPVANRQRPESQYLIGYLVNTVVLALTVTGQDDFLGILGQAKHTLLEAQAHSDLPFEHLVDALQPERRLGQNPLFQILINHQPHDPELLAVPGWRTLNLERANGAAPFDLSLDTWQDRQDGIGGVFTYALDLFDASTIERLSGHYQNLLARLLARPQAVLATHDLLSPAESAQFAAWNRWPQTYPASVPVHELIRRQAEAQPQAVALVCGDVSLTYAELETQANRLAHRLLNLGRNKANRVALLLPRRAETIVAMLAVLKAGAACLPLEPGQPQQRLAAVLAEADVGLVLAWRRGAAAKATPATSEGGQGEGLPPYGKANHDGANGQPGGAEATAPPYWLYLAEPDGSNRPATPPDLAIHPGQLAYLIHTSGSTGTPKCVAVPHGALVKHCLAISERYRMRPDDVALHFAAFTFDAAMEQWLVPLLNGCRLVIRDELWGADQAHQALVRHQVTWCDLPPAYLTEMARSFQPHQWRPALRGCVVGGEALAQDSLAQCRRLLAGAPIFNGYGPTETVITPLLWTALPDSVCATAYAPIGTAVGERTLHILDNDLNPLPPGAIGELYIGGPCLAHGYHGRPALTAERFLPDPFSGDGGRLYRTGDRVRFCADGNVAYFGRNDQQIKLRGHRIEPGEIEARALAHPEVAEAVALTDGDGDAKRLLLYAAGATDAETLKNHLRQGLPDYMVPTHILMLDKLPRLASGKLDRRTLPKPGGLAADPYRAPQSQAERGLAAIWQALLGVGQVGLDDNFFALGGDSILAIRLVSRARQAGWNLSPKAVFLHQTVAKLAAHLQAAVPATAAVSAPAAGDAPLTPIQAQFFAQDMPRREHWNLSLLLQPRAALDAPKLQHALCRLHGHHDSLRLRYREERGGWRQFYADPEAVGAAPGRDLLERHYAQDSQDVTRIAQQAQRALNLQHGPLFKAVLIELADGGQRLLLAAHHLLVDGVSWRILLEDLQALYDGAQALPATTATFQQWGKRLRGYADSEALRGQLPYWQAVLRGGAEPPRDFLASNGNFGAARTLTLTLDTEPTRQLLGQANCAYRTQSNDLLLTALARVLDRWCGGTALVELESHGRDHGFDGIDLSRSVGWFTSVYPVRLGAAADIGGTIKAVKQNLRQVPDAGLGFGVLQYLADGTVRQTLQTLPQANIGFNYFGQLDAEAGHFMLAPDSAGDDHDPDAPLPYWLEINAQVSGARLQVRWRYSASQYRRETVQALLEDYRDELLAVIAHCLSGAHGATPSDFPLAGLTQAQLDALPLDFAEVEDIYPLSPLQQGLLFHDALAPDTGVYVNQMTLDIDGLDAERFAAAWRRAIAGHAILRTGFLWRDEAGQPLQVVYKHAPLPLTLLDWRGRPDSGPALQALCAKEHQRGFDPVQAPLQRLVLVRVSDSRYRWVWTCHHILLDGWSSSQLLGEVLDAYVGKPARPATSRYRDYIAWLQAKSQVADEEFWRGYLAKLDRPTRLAAVLAGEPGGRRQQHFRLRLDAADSQRLQQFANHQKVTLNTVLQAAWAILLQRYCGQDVVVFGATLSGRSPELNGIEQTLGLFINTLPVVAEPAADKPLAAFLQALQQDNLALREHEHTPLYDIQRWAGQAGVSLFDSLLVFENFPIDAALANTETGLQFGIPEHLDNTHYPLTLSVNLKPTLEMDFSYQPSAFQADDIGRMAACLLCLLQDMAARPGLALGGLAFPAPGAATAAYVLDTGLNPLPMGVAGELYRRCDQTHGHLEKFEVPLWDRDGSPLSSAQLLEKVSQAQTAFELDEEENRQEGAVSRPPQTGQPSPGQTAERFLPDPYSAAAGARMFRTGDRARQRPDGSFALLGRVGQTRHNDRGAGQADKQWPQAQTKAADRSHAVGPALAEIWQALLGVGQVGADDHFFELGGHSLLAMRLSATIKRRLGADVTVRQVFATPRFADMVALIDGLLAASANDGLADGFSAALAELDALSADELKQLIANQDPE